MVLHQQESTLKTNHFPCLPHSYPPSTWLPKCCQWGSPLQNQHWLDAVAQQAVSERNKNIFICQQLQYRKYLCVPVCRFSFHSVCTCNMLLTHFYYTLYTVFTHTVRWT